MLRLPRFRYLAPRTLDDAVLALSDAGALPSAESAAKPRVRVVAGGTDLWPNLKRRHEQAETVISLLGIRGLAGIEADPNGAGDLAIGAATRLADLERDSQVARRFPALARAVASISSPPLREMGTLGGNLLVDTRCTYYNQTEEWRRAIGYCLKEKGETCWVATSSPRCLAHAASDAAPALAALGGEVELVSARGARRIPVLELYRDDGQHFLAKAPDEILTRIHLPADSAAFHCRASFHKLRRRGSIDFAVGSVAAAVWLDARGGVERARIVLGAVASCPREATAAQESLLGQPLTSDSIATAARLARKVATPFDNTDFQAQWRGAMVERLVVQALGELSGEQGGDLGGEQGDQLGDGLGGGLGAPGTATPSTS